MADSNFATMARALRAATALFIVVAVSTCATKTVAPYARPAPEHAQPAAPSGAFADIESRIHALHGPETSGFKLIDRNEDGLRWRLMLIDSAQRSIDLQYYLWYADNSARILAKHLIDAADRGVRIRMLIDDISTVLKDAGTFTVRDQVAALMDAHPNLAIRLFNPWTTRNLAGRLGEGINDLPRLNQRMHNKSIIVDNRAVIIGGRNIGDEYMGLHESFNFHDLDVLGIGPVARQASKVFDAYWNSDWVMPASALGVRVTPEDQAQARATLSEKLAAAEALARFPIPPQSWSSELAQLADGLQPGSSRVYSDLPADSVIDHVMLEQIYAMLGRTKRELLIVNAYIIPAERGINALHTLDAQGVDIKILTNSLASHDVPAVNSHYKKWRKPILEAGAELYEMRHDAGIQPLISDTPPTQAKFMGLHSKAMVIDRKRVYIGSMNFDPRSSTINTEMGVFIESEPLAESLAELILRDMQPANSWRVELDEQGGLRWVDDEETVTTQPARNFWQRVQDVFFKVVPKEYY
jgi:putative cardiolipin synthase